MIYLEKLNSHFCSHTEPDPVKIAVRYVEKMGKVNSDLIIIDTRGGHMSDESFFPEICNIEKATVVLLSILCILFMVSCF